MKVLIADYHAGCIETVAGALTADKLDIYSRSNHNRYLTPDVAKHLVAEPDGHYDWCISMFPPKFYQDMKAQDVADKYFVYISHRADLWLSKPNERRQFWREFVADIESGLVTAVAANEFDARYVEHYIGYLPPVVMPATGTGSDIGDGQVLVAPVNIRPDSPMLAAIASLSLATVRQRYPFYERSDLAKHRAIVMLPYSNYSQSLVEISDLAMPILMPTDRWLLANGGLDDVQLYPLYGSQDDVLAYEKQGGPNDPSIDARLTWGQYAYWRSCPNIYYWDNLDELRDLLACDVFDNYVPHNSDFFTEKQKSFRRLLTF